MIFIANKKLLNITLIISGYSHFLSQLANEGMGDFLQLYHWRTLQVKVSARTEQRYTEESPETKKYAHLLNSLLLHQHSLASTVRTTVIGWSNCVV